MSEKEEAKPVCGIVMPISELDGCSEGHWSDVHEILSEAVDAAGFDANLVSNADDVGIIQKRIIQNLYDNPIVLCDVSGKNPNVMFELGLRLAFDKPTIIVKDDKTSYSFDTSPIEHLEYPRDLRFTRIVEFKRKLTEKIRKTYQKAKDDANYTTFLKHFGEFKVARIEKKEVSGQEFILDELKSLRSAISRIELPRLRPKEAPERLSGVDGRTDFCLQGANRKEVDQIVELLFDEPESADYVIEDRNGHKHLHLISGAHPARLRGILANQFPHVGKHLKILARAKKTRNKNGSAD